MVASGGFCWALVCSSAFWWVLVGSCKINIIMNDAKAFPETVQTIS
jgi:hypothetical protein